MRQCGNASLGNICVVQSKSVSTTFPRLRPFLLHGLVITLLPTLLDALNVLVLALESASLLLSSQDFFNKSLLPVAILDATRVKLGRTFDDGADLGVLGDFELALLSVHALGIEDGAHVEELQVALESWREVGAGEIIPVRK